MKLKSIRIRNFRTIEAEQHLDFERGLTIVGANSSGKTNILRAIEMLFTGTDNQHNYDIQRDLTFGVNATQTGIIATFDGDPETDDKDFYDAYSELNRMLVSPKEVKSEFTLYLHFTKSGTPVYRFFSNETTKDAMKAQFSRKQLSTIAILFEKFVCHYVPSSKSINDLYTTLLLPFVRRSISELLTDRLKLINNKLSEIAGHLDSQLSLSGLSHIKSSFSLPNDSLEYLISHFDFRLSDPNQTPIERKGMGVQAASILSSFLWITREERKLKKSTIWLVEEPESYLHPELAESCSKMLDELRNESLLVTTTHSLGFVSQDPRLVVGTSLENGRTKINEYKTYVEATSSLREALGVRFSDYYNLGELNCFVEGKSDRETFQWALSLIKPELNSDYLWPLVRKCQFLDFTGVSGLEGFLKATYAFIHRERTVVVILDGDLAGNKTRVNLQQYLGQHSIPFESNLEYISLHSGFSLEGLFPHEWIIDIQKEHPNWFSEWSLDVEGKLQPFDIKTESNKISLRQALIRKAELTPVDEWASKFVSVFNVLQNAFLAKELSLAKRKAKKSGAVVS